MNCQECHEELTAYLEDLLDETNRGQVESHIAECATCQTELQEVRDLTACLTRDGLVMPAVSLDTAVMDRILQEQALELRRLKMRKRIRVLGISGAMAVAVTLLLIAGFWFAQPAVAEADKAAKVLAQGAEAVPNPLTVHIVTKMRTEPSGNFGTIGPKYDPVAIEVWRQFGDKPKWRMEEPGRVMVMDGMETVCLIRPNIAWKGPCASDENCAPALELTKVHDMVTRELSTALAKGWDMKLAHETTTAGEKELVVTVEARAGLPDDDYLKNKYLDSSDVRRVYRFDAKTQRLQGFEAYLHEPGGDVLVLTVEKIEYNQPIDPEVFTIKLPENVEWIKEPERLPDNEKYERMTPEQAARAFFEACAKEDWSEVQRFLSPINEGFKDGLGGLKIVSLGKPFQSEVYAGGKGWFIPYEIKLKDGTVKKHNLAMRNDNQGNRYVVDGGI